MASICDSCFTTDTGFIVEASYPYSTVYEEPERLYCIDGVPTAAPARAAVAPLGCSFVADPVSAPANGYNFVAPTATTISWTNLTPRSCNVFAFMDGFLIGGTAINGDYVQISVNISASDSQTTRGYAGLAVPYSAAATPTFASFSVCTDSITVAPGVSVSVFIAAAFATPTTTSAIINTVDAKAIFMGAAV